MLIFMKFTVIIIGYSRNQFLYNLFSFYHNNPHLCNTFIPQFSIRQLINFFCKTKVQKHYFINPKY
jgi:hypothetical protein